MSAETLEFHHGKHHKAYVNKTNELIESERRPRGRVADRRSSRSAKRAGNSKLFNNSAQLWNHSFFWQCLAPAAGPAARRQARQADRRRLRHAEALLDKLQEEAVNHFASGWAWLVLDRGKLGVTSLHDADTPIVHDGMVPLVHARCVGACLLHRLSQRAAAASRERCCRTSSTGTSSPRTSTARASSAPNQEGEGARSPELTA